MTPMDLVVEVIDFIFGKRVQSGKVLNDVAT